MRLRVVFAERDVLRRRRSRQFLRDDAARRGNDRRVGSVQTGRDDFQRRTEVGARRRIGRARRAVDRGFGAGSVDAEPLERDVRRRRGDRNRQLFADFRRVGREIEPGQNVGRGVEGRFDILGIARRVRSVNAENIALGRVDRSETATGRVGFVFRRFPVRGADERDGDDVSRFVVGVIVPLHRQFRGGRVVIRQDQAGRRGRSDQRRNGRGDGGGRAEIVERRNAIFVRAVRGQTGRDVGGRVGGERVDERPLPVDFRFDAVTGFVGDVGPSQRRALLRGVVGAELNVGRGGRRDALILVSAEVGGGSGNASGARQIGFGRGRSGREVDNLSVFREGVIAVFRVGEERFRRVVSERAFGSVVGQDGLERDAGDRGAVPDEDRVDGLRAVRGGNERGAGDVVVDDGRVNQERGGRIGGDVNRALTGGGIVRDHNVAEDGGAGFGRFGGGDFGVRENRGGRRSGRRTDQIDLRQIDFVRNAVEAAVNERVADVDPRLQRRRNVAFAGRDYRQRREQHRGRLNAVRFFLIVVQDGNPVFVFAQRFVTEVGGGFNIGAARVEKFGVKTVVGVKVFQVERRVFELQDERERDVALQRHPLRRREVFGPKLNAQRAVGRRRVGRGNFVVAKIFVLAFPLFVIVSVVGGSVGQDGGQARRVAVGQADVESVRVDGRASVGGRRGDDEFDVAQVEVERVIGFREEFQRQRVPGDGRFGGQRVGEFGRQFDGVLPIAFAEVLREVDFDRFAERRGDVRNRSGRFRRVDFLFLRELEIAAINRRAVFRRFVGEELRIFDRNPTFVGEGAAANGRGVVRENRVFEVKVAGVGDRAAEVRRTVRNFDRTEFDRPALDRERAVDVVRVDFERSVITDNRQGALRRVVEFDRNRFVARLEGQRSAADDKNRVVARRRGRLRDRVVQGFER